MKRTISTLILMLILHYLVCTPLPLETENNFPIRLSLEKMGIREAEFSGEPISVIIETPDSMMFSSLTWRTGSATYRTVDTTLLKKAKRFTASLTWKKYPMYKDSADKVYYDTIYIGTGGNLYRSNNVRIKVSNLPVIIDSLKVGEKTFKMSDPLWNYNVPDSIVNLQIRMYARDLDGTTPEIELNGNNFVIEKNGILPMQYQCVIPAGAFRDTLNFMISDHSRGQAFRTLYLNRTYVNTPPVIDSVRIESKNYLIVNGSIKATYPKIDTLHFKAFYHDRFDSVKLSSWKSSRNIVKKDSLYPELMTYICTLTVGKDSSTMLTFIDTVWLTIYDSQKDSSRISVVLFKGIQNRPPVIDAVLLNGSPIKESAGTIPVIGVTGLLDYKLKVKVSDPDSNKLKILWNSKSTIFLTKNDTSVTCTTPITLTRDTISVIVSDEEFSVDKKFIFDINDLAPTFDSLTINKVRYFATGATYTCDASVGELLTIIAFVRDPDTKDTMKYIWEMKDTSKIVSKSGGRLVLQLPSKVHNDTINLFVRDGVITNSYMILIKVDSQIPFIDSIRVKTKLFIPKTDSISDSVSYPATIPVKLFSHDNQLDSLKYVFRANVQKNLMAVDSTLYNYTVNDSTFVDTVKVTVTDSRGNMSGKNIRLIIKGTK